MFNNLRNLEPGTALQPKLILTTTGSILVVMALSMLIIPAVMLGVSLLLGFGPVERFLLMILYITPVAASSYPMAQNMGGDGPLAGEMVVLSTVLSVVTLFLWIVLLGNLALM